MYRLLLFTALFFRCMAAGAQENHFVFSHLTEDNGLVDNVVNSFLKDRRGMLWIGTYNGLSRFDGSNFYNYKKRKGNNSIPNEVVHKLCEDREGNIWGAVNGGVFRYAPKQDSFASYTVKNFDGPASCYNIICDRQGRVWAAGGSSIFRYNAGEGRFDKIIALASGPDSASHYFITKNGLREDAVHNGFWIATVSGLMYYDIKKQALLNYKTSSAPLFRRRSVSALSIPAKDKCWLFDYDTKKIIQFNTSLKEEIKQVNIRNIMPKGEGATLFEDSNQRLWFSSWTYQMLVVDQRNNDKISTLQHQHDDKLSVAGDFFWDAYEDEDKNIWLGTVAGISTCNPEKTAYKLYQLPNIIPDLNNAAIQLAEEDSVDGSIWMVTSSSLLIQYHPANQRYASYSLKMLLPGTAVAKSGFYNGIKFFNGQPIISAKTGTWVLSKESKKIVPFNFLPAGFKDFQCKDMAADGDSVLYYTNGSAILYWNYIAGQSKLISRLPGADSAALPKITKLVFTASRQLWVWGSNNFTAWLNNKKELVQVNIVNNKPGEVGTLMALDQDSKNNIWLLNKGVGIYRYNPANGEIKAWDETDGLAGNRIHKIITDKDGRVWNMIYNKVSVYIPGSDKFYNFKIPYSESNLAYYNHLGRLANGNIMASINNDLVEFYPERLQTVPVKIKPQISGLFVAGKNISLLQEAGIVLEPDENTVRFRFGSFINKEIFPYDIEYKLATAEQQWTVAGENREALYNNLNPGKYSFHVRVKGKNGDWQTEEASLSFIIKSPFYKTALFIIIMALLLAAILFIIYRNRLQQKEKLMSLENKAQALQKEKAMVMYESLKQQLNPHFLFNSLSSLNTLIEDEPKAAGEFLDSLSKTYRYILKSRDNETVPLADEIQFAANYVKLQKTRFEKGFDVHINIPEEYHYHKIVPVTLQNLVENAIKHNIIDEESPLLVNIYIDKGFLVVENNLQRKNFVETSNRQGLYNMQSLYQYLSRQPVEIIETATSFTIKLPLL